MSPTNRPVPPIAEQGVGAAMRAARESRGISLRQMAKKVGYSAHSNLSDYESGKRLPPEQVVTQYERVLELEPGSLTARLELALDQPERLPSLERSSPDPANSASPIEDGENSATADVVSPLPRSKRPRWIQVVGIAIASALLGGVITYWVVTRASAHQSTPQPAAALYPDGADPDATGCKSDAVKPDRVNVYDPPEHLVGTLELVSSPRCGMSWGRFVPTVALTRSPTVLVHIDMHRPSDGTTAPFAVDFDGQPAYGNMMASREECVYATITLVRNGQATVPFATQCFRAPGS